MMKAVQEGPVLGVDDEFEVVDLPPLREAVKRELLFVIIVALQRRPS